MSSEAPGVQTHDDDEHTLHKLGYAQVLYREMGGFSNFAISFSIISILTGAVLLYGYGLKLAGPIVNTVGWPVVSLFTLAVAASMAEIASVASVGKKPVSTTPACWRIFATLSAMSSSLGTRTSRMT